MRPRPPVSTDPDKVRARLEGAARWMARQTEPGRNVALRDMARTLLLDGIDDLSLLAEAAHSTGLSAGEISRTLDSVRRYVLRGAS